MAEQVYAKTADEFNQAERSGKRNNNVPGHGLYRHPNGQEAIVIDDPLWGNTQAQAFSRLGFEFVRDVEPDEIVTLPEMAMNTREAEQSNLKGLTARMESLEREAAQKSELEKEVAELRAQLAEKQEAEDVAKAKAEKDAEDLAAKQAEADKQAETDKKVIKSSEKKEDK